MKLNLLFFLITSLFILSPAHAGSKKNRILSPTLNEKASFIEYKAIEKALQPYIKSAKTGKGSTISNSFYAHAHIVGSVGGTFYNADLETFKKSITNGGPSPRVQHHIAWIDISGPAAAAKVEFYNWSGFRFTDFFILYKHEGKWKISGKVYNSHEKN